MDDKALGAAPAGDRLNAGASSDSCTRMVSVPMSVDDLYDLGTYWMNVHEYAASFNPAIKIGMPAAEYSRFSAYRQDPGAFKRAQQQDGDQADAGGLGCKHGCRVAAIIFAIGVIACILVVAMVAIAQNPPQSEDRGGLASVVVNGTSIPYTRPAEDKTAHKRFLEAVRQPSDIAYLVRVCEPNNAYKVSSCVFVPVEITHEGEDGFSMANYLFPVLEPNENARDIFYSESSDPHIAEKMEELGYPALSRALSEGDRSQTSGTHLVFFAFDVDAPEYWDPQVNLRLSEDGRALKAFTYHVQEADLEELESIAQEEWGQEGSDAKGR